MKSYGFLVGHGYQILKGYVKANSEDDATKKILSEEWDDVIDEYDKDDLTDGYDIIELWEIMR